jgi:hypothetical protein
MRVTPGERLLDRLGGRSSRLIEQAPMAQVDLDLSLPVCMDDEAEHEVQHRDRDLADGDRSTAF